LTLLKILDPSSTPVLGDLYFELHEEKREVYVVTHIDREAWPDGVGYIRYGFAPERVGQFANEAEFRSAYLAAVQAYESVRRALDSLPEGAEPDRELLALEPVLREGMNSFTGLRALRVGDVVEVPLLVPHALLHGVRTVEFQTPTYERKILSFAQKVLTQDHWDTTVGVESFIGQSRRYCYPAAGKVCSLRHKPRSRSFSFWLCPAVEWLNQGRLCGRLCALVAALSND
jgi:hypothetical protein